MMEISSAATALALLRGGRGPAPAAIKIEPPRVDPAVRFDKAEPVEDVSFYGPPDLPWIDHRKMREHVERWTDMARKSVSGEVGPFDPELVEMSGHKKLFDRSFTDPRLQFVGVFIPTSADSIGKKAPMGEAKFTERRDAMAVAYHFGRELSKHIDATVKAQKWLTDDMFTATGQLIGISPTGQFLQGNDILMAKLSAGTDDIIDRMRGMEKNAASLASRFGFDSTSVTTAAYAGERKGFSISLGAFGKLADFGADGSITLYGSDGTAYSAADYNVAQVDGGIPELHNHEVLRHDQEVIYERIRQARLKA